MYNATYSKSLLALLSLISCSDVTDILENPPKRKTCVILYPNRCPGSLDLSEDSMDKPPGLHYILFIVHSVWGVLSENARTITALEAFPQDVSEGDDAGNNPK